MHHLFARRLTQATKSDALSKSGFVAAIPEQDELKLEPPMARLTSSSPITWRGLPETDWEVLPFRKPAKLRL
jgi:hypothetical protein